MQLLLTEEEYDLLVPTSELERAELALKWCFGRLQPIECPHREENRGMPYPYCDVCPIDQISDRKISKLICKRSRNYSK